MARTFLQKLLDPTFIRYVLIGGSGYLFEMAVITGSHAFGASPVLAVSLSFWSGTILSFFLQKIVTFGDVRMHHRTLITQALAVGALILFNYGFTIVLTHLLDDLLPVALIRTIALAITTMWNFIAYKRFIFKQAAPDNPKDSTAS